MADREWYERLAQARRMLSVDEWRDVTQEEIGARVGKSGATISRYERGLLPVPKAMMIALEAVLRFPPEKSSPAATGSRAKSHSPLKTPDEIFGEAARKQRGGSK